MSADDLIPLGLRIAVRNAVGGWGPYSVREIHDLFNSYGFTSYDPDIPDAGGDRRTTAEGYHARIDWKSRDAARQYVDVVAEVLEHYPEPDDDPKSVGSRLRRELRRAGITRSSDGRLQLPHAATEASDALAAATEGIWSADAIRVFVSHVSEHRARVTQLAEELNRFAFSCFVAHAQIEPSRAWQDAIELALNTADALVAYVTPGFRESAWTDQEVGWALGRGAIIIPLRVGATPYGFCGTFQALTVDEGERPAQTAAGVARAIAVAVFRGQRPGAERLLDRMTNAVIEALCISRSFDATRRRWELVELIPRRALTVEHISRMRQAAVENSQVREAILVGRGPVPEAIEQLASAAGVGPSAS
jgi:hypothetical protein